MSERMNRFILPNIVDEGNGKIRSRYCMHGKAPKRPGARCQICAKLSRALFTDQKRAAAVYCFGIRGCEDVAEKLEIRGFQSPQEFCPDLFVDPEEAEHCFRHKNCTFETIGRYESTKKIGGTGKIGKIEKTGNAGKTEKSGKIGNAGKTGKTKKTGKAGKAICDHCNKLRPLLWNFRKSFNKHVQKHGPYPQLTSSPLSSLSDIDDDEMEDEMDDEMEDVDN